MYANICFLGLLIKTYSATFQKLLPITTTFDTCQTNKKWTWPLYVDSFRAMVQRRGFFWLNRYFHKLLDSAPSGMKYKIRNTNSKRIPTTSNTARNKCFLHARKLYWLVLNYTQDIPAFNDKHRMRWIIYVKLVMKYPKTCSKNNNASGATKRIVSLHFRLHSSPPIFENKYTDDFRTQIS